MTSGRSGRRPCVEVLDVAQYEKARAALSREPARLIEFTAGDTVEQFFETCRDRLPMDPPISGRVNWDALEDSLWGGLNGLPDEEVLLVWADAWKLRRGDPESYAVAEEILRTICAQLSAGEYGSEQKSVRTIIVGTG